MRSKRKNLLSRTVSCLEEAHVENFPWIIIMLVPSLGFFLFLIYANIRHSRRPKARGLPPTEPIPPRSRNGRRKNITYVVVDENRRRPRADEPQPVD